MKRISELIEKVDAGKLGLPSLRKFLDEAKNYSEKEWNSLEKKLELLCHEMDSASSRAKKARRARANYLVDHAVKIARRMEYKNIALISERGVAKQIKARALWHGFNYGRFRSFPLELKIGKL